MNFNNNNKYFYEILINFIKQIFKSKLNNKYHFFLTAFLQAYVYKNPSKVHFLEYFLITWNLLLSNFVFKKIFSSLYLILLFFGILDLLIFLDYCLCFLILFIIYVYSCMLFKEISIVYTVFPLIFPKIYYNFLRYLFSFFGPKYKKLVNILNSYGDLIFINYIIFSKSLKKYALYRFILLNLKKIFEFIFSLNFIIITDFLWFVLIFPIKLNLFLLDYLYDIWNKIKKNEVSTFFKATMMLNLFNWLTMFLFFYHGNVVLKLLVLPLCAILHILIMKSEYWIKIWNIFWAFIILTNLFLVLGFYQDLRGKQLGVLCLTGYKFNFYGMDTYYFFDILSIIFIGLTCIIFLFVFFMLFGEDVKNIKSYSIIIYILYFFLLNVFLAQNLFFFFFFFESVVFPMFAIILIGGSRYQKVKAAYYFFFFTVFGSLFMFISLNYLYNMFGTLNIIHLMFYMNELPLYIRNLIWLSFSLSFFIKIPTIPFHTWLPEAHVEAPTIGSVILAGVLLKLGIYGIIRVNFFLLPHSNVYFSQYVYVLCLLSIFYACIIAIRQTDIKRIIAYASIAHMNLMVLGLYSFTSVGIYGAIYQSISHGLVSSALFFLIGVLYKRYKSRSIVYYSGLTQPMPIFSFFFFFFTLANISFPLTSNFIGELLIFTGISKLTLGILVLSLFGIVLNTIYSLWLCNRMLFGNVKSHLLLGFKDLTKLEIFLFSSLMFLVLLLGIFPNMIGSIDLPTHTHQLVYIIKAVSYVHLALKRQNETNTLINDSDDIESIIF